MGKYGGGEDYGPIHRLKNLERVKAAKPLTLDRPKNSQLGYNFRGGVPVIFLLNGSQNANYDYYHKVI